MAEIFNTLIRESDKVISLVGGGGKTSLMFLLAREFQQKGFRVVSTTTTRILRPTSLQSGAVVVFDEDGFSEKLEHYLELYNHVTVARRLSPEGDKLQGIDPSQVEQILQYPFVERIIIEADGARQLPLKVPGDNEPVVPEMTDLFVCVVGLDCMGKSLEETNVFRAGLVASRSGLEIGDTITAMTVAQLAVHPEGFLKGCPKGARSCIFLNKSDIKDVQEEVLAVIQAAKELERRKPVFWLSGSVKNNVCEIH